MHADQGNTSPYSRENIVCMNDENLPVTHETPLISGLHKEVQSVLVRENPKRVFLVCKSSLSEEEQKKIFDGYESIRFNEYSSNPTLASVEKASKVFLNEDCDLIIAVGGGSAIDLAKAAKWFTADQKRETPLWAIPTTAGTGSEATPFAVYYEGDKKVSIDDPTILPSRVFLCGEFLSTVPAYHKKASYLDALCQALESWWSKRASRESVEYARSAIKFLLRYKKHYFCDDVQNNREEILQSILRASNLAGRAIAITRTTAAHALSYGLTSRYGIAHGHAVGLCFPYVWSLNADKINPKSSLHSVMLDMANSLGCTKIDEVPHFFNEMLSHFEMQKYVVEFDDIAVLAKSVNVERLKNNPVELSEEDVRFVYEHMVYEGI